MQQSWEFYTTNEIKPSGWMKQQLILQAEGLNGQLDNVWPDVRDSAWIGGTAEGWERVPYWLDGFLSLAYLLENEDMIARGRKYIDAILSRQQPDGWICPCSPEQIPSYDNWPVLLISKVLLNYYRCSRDERIPDALYRLMKNYYDLLSNGTIRLFGWARYRWFEGFEAISFLLNRCHEDWLISLARILKEQGVNYDHLIPKWKRPLYQWTRDTHVVNLAMMLKSEAVSHELLGEEYTDHAEYLWEILTRYNGTPAGIFTGDECLAGLSPIQGTELCAVVELMYCFELLYAHTGDAKWAERLERTAFNALPAAISDDMWAHQYDQMSNQITCQKLGGRSIFGTNNDEAHIFGLEPHFGCCTANFGQGWPKLALSAFLHRGNIIQNAIPIPGTLCTDGISITLETDYPFRNELSYTIKAERAFTFQIRVPSFAEHLTVNGEPRQNTGMLAFSIPENETCSIRVAFDAAPRFIDRPHDLKTVVWGSLVFSLPIAYQAVRKEYTAKGVERKYPYCDYEYIAVAPWQYGYSGGRLEPVFHGVGEIPFSSKQPPVTIRTKAAEIDWGLETGFQTVCAKVPSSRNPLSDEKDVELYPYGCAKLRMTELPFTT